MTYYLYKDAKKGKKVLCNYRLNNINYEKVNIIDLFNLEDSENKFNNITLGIDEITVYVDCRTSMSKRNRLFSWFILQSRKRNNNIYYTTQNISFIEMRLRQFTDIEILCQKLYDKHNKPYKNIRRFTLVDYRNPSNPVISGFDMDIRPYFNLYDTDELITPYEMFNEKKKYEG